MGVGGTAFLTAFVAGWFGGIPLPRVDVEWDHRSGRTEPIAAMETGEELALVYIGSSNCYWSNVEGLPFLVRDARSQLRPRARAARYHFAAVGIARDRDVDNGLRHLRKMGEFDEVMTGRGWLNIGVLKYVYEDLPGPAITPQVLVVRRWLDRDTVIGIREEDVLLRKVGFTEIETWVRQGAYVPGLVGLEPEGSAQQ